jgi:predicted Zn-dependent peptidase
LQETKAPRASESYLAYEGRVKTFLLENGLKLLALKRDRAPFFSFRTYVNAGSADEEPGKTGLAHLFEHMAFKGSREIGTRDYARESSILAEIEACFRRLQKAQEDGDEEMATASAREFVRLQEEARGLVEPNEFALIVEQEGGVGINAFTTNDSTQYFYSLPANRLELWAYLESERFADPVLREFYTERDVVMEERRMSTDNSPIGRFYEKWVEAAFGKDHPYGRPVIGYAEDLARLTMSDAEAFFRKYYNARNMTIAVVGDVEPEEVCRVAEVYLSRIPGGEPNERKVSDFQPGSSERRFEMTDPAQPMLLVGYLVPRFNHPHRHPVNALQEVLGGTRSSRLYRRLVKEERKAIALEVTLLPGNRYDRLLTIYALPAPGIRAEALLPLIDDEISRLLEKGILEAELDRFRARSLAGMIRQMNSNSGLAGMLTFYEVLAGSWRALFSEMDLIRALTVEEVLEAARHYLAPTNRTVGILETNEER